MAGHPTIGTAYAILSQSRLAPKSSERLVFDLGAGPLGELSGALRAFRWKGNHQ